MSYTKAQIRTAVMQEADAVVGSSFSSRWDTTVGGEVDRIISMVFEREWRRILAANRYYRTQKVTTTTDASTGRIPISALTTGAGDTAKRFHRVINVEKGLIPYRQVELADMPLAESLGASPYSWYQEGTDLMFLPKEFSASFNIIVNWLPVRPDALSLETSVLDFPTEWEELLRYEAAAWVLSKGGAESPAVSDLKTLAEDIRVDMLQEVARVSTNPDQMRFPDHPFTWGG